MLCTINHKLFEVQSHGCCFRLPAAGRHHPGKRKHQRVSNESAVPAGRFMMGARPNASPAMRTNWDPLSQFDSTRRQTPRGLRGPCHTVSRGKSAAITGNPPAGIESDRPRGTLQFPIPVPELVARRHCASHRGLYRKFFRSIRGYR